MLPWLIPVALFWTLAALYLGGASISFEGGGGGRQLSGLFLLFVSFLVLYGVLRMILGGLLGPAMGGIVIPVVIASVTIPFLAKLAFKVAGVRITRVRPGAAH